MNESPQTASGEASATETLRFLVRIVSFCLLLTIGISWQLYAPGFRLIGMTPLVESLSHLPPVLNWVVLACCIFCLLALQAFPLHRLALCGVLACELFWMLQDITRLQPYGYMYCFTLFAVAASGKRTVGAFDALRVMICGVYFWAGFHKLNLTFYSFVMPWFIEPLYHFDPNHRALLDTGFTLAIYATPFFEAAIGILLFFPRTRKFATVMAFIMLVVVLFCLGPLGHNWAIIVWPWNIYLFLMECRLFFKRDPTVPAFPLFSHPQPLSILSAALFMLAPALAIYNVNYVSLGFKLYSGNVTEAYIQLAPEETLARAPARLRDLPDSDHTLSLNAWSDVEFKSPIYLAPFAYKAAAAALCPYLDAPSHAELIIYMPAPFDKKHPALRDNPLSDMEKSPLCP